MRSFAQYRVGAAPPNRPRKVQFNDPNGSSGGESRFTGRGGAAPPSNLGALKALIPSRNQMIIEFPT